MSSWFCWLLDARLHLTLFVSVVGAAIGQMEPAGSVDSHTDFNVATVVRYRDGSTSESLAMEVSRIAEQARGEVSGFEDEAP